jgi:hypothetical protein
MEIDMKYYRTRETTAHLWMFDTDWVVTIEYEFINKGSRGSYYEPPEAPDFDIERIWLSRDEAYNKPCPKWEITGQMFRLISAMDNVSDAVIDDINEA